MSAQPTTERHTIHLQALQPFFDLAGRGAEGGCSCTGPAGVADCCCCCSCAGCDMRKNVFSVTCRDQSSYWLLLVWASTPTLLLRMFTTRYQNLRDTFVYIKAPTSLWSRSCKSHWELLNLSMSTDPFRLASYSTLISSPSSKP